MKKNYLVAVVGLFVLLFGAGCSTKSINSKLVLEESVNSTNKPDWASSDRVSWTEKGVIYYRSMAEGYDTVQIADRAARAEVKQSIAEEIRETIRSEFRSAVESGPNSDSTGYLSNAFMSVVDNLEVSGLRIERVWISRIYEKGSEQEFYRAYALGSISESEYNKLKRAALSKTKSKIDPSTKRLAEEVEKRFFETESQRSENE